MSSTAERAQPLLGQRAPEIQPYGTLAQYPIALDARVRGASIEALNQILADTMMLGTATVNRGYMATAITG
jgi:hypothetical protein